MGTQYGRSAKERNTRQIQDQDRLNTPCKRISGDGGGLSQVAWRPRWRHWVFHGAGQRISDVEGGNDNAVPWVGNNDGKQRQSQLSISHTALAICLYPFLLWLRWYRRDASRRGRARWLLSTNMGCLERKLSRIAGELKYRRVFTDMGRRNTTLSWRCVFQSGWTTRTVSTCRALMTCFSWQNSVPAPPSCSQ